MCLLTTTLTDKVQLPLSCPLCLRRNRGLNSLALLAGNGSLQYVPYFVAQMCWRLVKPGHLRNQAKTPPTTGLMEFGRE